MRHNLVQLEDPTGRKFHIEVWTPSVETRVKRVYKGKSVWYAGDWAVIDRGFIRYSEGAAWRVRGDRNVLNRRADLLLGPTFGSAEQKPNWFQSFQWGIVLYSYNTDWFTRDAGSGHVLQPWVLNFEPGPIDWRRPSESEMVASYASRLSRAAKARP